MSQTDKATFMRRARIVKRYGNRTGRRFARVEFGNWFTDVVTRSSRNDGEETRAAQIKELAWVRFNERGLHHGG